jgi:hypothetical protein
MITKKLKTILFAPFLALVLASCGDDVATPADLAGTYNATLFETTVGGNTTDHLATGASITVTLVADLTVTGRLFAPGGNEDGTDLDADLTGTWTLLRNSLRMDSEADTFVRGVDWVVVPGGILTATGVFDDVTVEVVLER